MEEDDELFAGNDESEIKQDDAPDQNSSDNEISEDEKKTKPKMRTEKAASWQVTCDHEALKAGFDAPYSITFEVSDQIKKKNLVSAAVEVIDEIKTKYGEKDDKVKMFRRWFCHTLNLPDSIFNDPESFKTELRKIDGGIDDLLNTKTEVSSMETVKNPRANSQSLLHETVPSYLGKQLEKIVTSEKDHSEDTERDDGEDTVEENV